MRWFRHIWNKLTDENYRNWGVMTSDIPGSHCGLCGVWVEGDPGDPSWPPDERWGMCRKCRGPHTVTISYNAEKRKMEVKEK